MSDPEIHPHDSTKSPKIETSGKKGKKKIFGEGYDDEAPDCANGAVSVARRKNVPEEAITTEHSRGRRTVDAQEEHDLAMSKRKKVSKESRKKVEALLAEKSGSSLQPEPLTAFDPIKGALRRNPGLTREEAEEMARAFGF